MRPVCTLVVFSFLLYFSDAIRSPDSWLSVLLLIIGSGVYGFAVDTAKQELSDVFGYLLGLSFLGSFFWFYVGGLLVSWSLLKGDPEFKLVYFFSIIIVTGFYFVLSLIGRWRGRPGE